MTTKHERAANDIIHAVIQARVSGRGSGIPSMAEIAAILAEAFPEPEPVTPNKDPRYWEGDTLFEIAADRIASACEDHGECDDLRIGREEMEDILRGVFPEPEPPFLTAAHGRMLDEMPDPYIETIQASTSLRNAMLPSAGFKAPESEREIKSWRTGWWYVNPDHDNPAAFPYARPTLAAAIESAHAALKEAQADAE